MTTFGSVNIWVCITEDLAACSIPDPWYIRISHQTSKYSKAVEKQISPLHFIFHFKTKKLLNEESSKILSHVQYLIKV